MSVVDIETVTKIIGVLGVLFPIFKGTSEWMNGKTSKMREEYRFSKEFLTTASSGESLHPFVLEKGYQALAGSRNVTIQEVQYILELEDSPSRLNEFVKGFKYIQHLSISGQNEISFRRKYMSNWSRMWRKSFYFFAYGLFFFLAFFPFIFAGPLAISVPTMLKTLVFTIPTLGAYAALSVVEGIKIASAERFIKMQRRRLL